MKTIVYDGPGDVLEVQDMHIPRGVPTEVSDDIAAAVSNKVTVVSTADVKKKGGD